MKVLWHMKFPLPGTGAWRHSSTGHYLELYLPNQRSVTQYLCGNFAGGGCCWRAAPAEGTVTTSLRDTHARAPTHTHKYTLSLSCSTLSWSQQWWFGDRPAWIFKQQPLLGPGSSLRPHYLTWCCLNPGPAGSSACSRATLPQLLQLPLLPIPFSLPQPQPWSFQTEHSGAPLKRSGRMRKLKGF